MAIMIDAKPSFRGEAKTWDSLSVCFDNDVVVYNNREINGREFDFCLLMENLGILVIEVKGWLADKIEVRGVDEIYVDGYDKPQRSPKKQARAYRFALLDQISKKHSVSPLVFDMVCYPFITQAEYAIAHLDIVSDVGLTLFKEDLESKSLLEAKIQAAYSRYENIPHVEFTHGLFSDLRQDWEPRFKQETLLDTDEKGPYSLVSFFPNGIDEDSGKRIVREYFAGIKRIIFISSEKDHKDLVESFDKAFADKNIQPGTNRLEIGYKKPLIAGEKQTRAFNLEVYVFEGLPAIVDASFDIEEGNCSPLQHELLEKMASKTAFNYQQYCVEHACPERNTLVEAGAGTGKTYSMVSRVAFLCNNLIDPVTSLADEVAMVTFTNDAASNMKVRLKQMFINYFILTGSPKYLKMIDDVDRAIISTIHSFTIKLLRKEVLYSGLGTNFRITSNEFLRSRFYDHFLSEYLNKKENENEDFVNEIPVPVYDLKKKLMAVADKLVAKSIDVDSITPASMGVTVKNSIPFFNELIAYVIVPAEKAYSEELRLSNDLDLKESVIRLEDVLDQHFEVIKSLRLKYLFIDEFQDTDDVQIKVFAKLQGLINADCRLFVVGDLKQSIYRFRGAALSAFDRIKSRSKYEWSTYGLTTNYRTDYRLLEEYHSIFSEMGSRGFLPYDGIRDRLASAMVSDYSNDELLSCIPFRGNAEGAFADAFFGALARERGQLEEIIHKREAEGKIPLSKAERTIAVLVRSNWQVEKIVSACKQRRIAIETKSGGDLFQLESTFDLYKLTQALCNSSNPIYLVNLIESNFVKASLDYQKLRGSDSGETLTELTRILDEYFQLRTNQTWRQIVNCAYTQPILSVIKQIYDDLQPWKQYSFNRREQQHYVANYEYLIETMIKRSRVDSLTLNQIAEYLRICILTQHEQASRDAIEEDEEITVLCTTVHKAKGLEYGTVILPYTYEEIGNIGKIKLDANYVDSKLSYYVTFDNAIEEYNSNFEARDEVAEQLAEESRILYVALTRAIRNCVWMRNLDSKAAINWSTFLEA